MINTVIAYDNFDNEIGDYFNRSYLHLDELRNQTTISITGIDGGNCSQTSINDLIPLFNQSPFVFVGLSHGTDDGLSLRGIDYYIQQNNANLFLNSFFYSTACHIGRCLGDILISHNCKCFIGYTDKSEVPLVPDYEDLFIECELHALKNFFLTTKSIQVLYDEMIAFTDEKIIEIANVDVLEAMSLIRNRDRFVIIGTDDDKSLTSLDFSV